MALHYSSGRLLLKNTTNNSWYFVDIEVFETLPTLRVAQAATSITGTYSQYAVLKTSGGAYYKFYLVSVDDVVHYGLDPIATPEPPQRLYIKSSDNIYREVIATQAPDGHVYVEIVLPGTNVATIDTPWRPISLVAEDVTLRKSITSVSTTDEGDITVPTNV